MSTQVFEWSKTKAGDGADSPGTTREFACDVRVGLAKPQKELHSKYLYDPLGSSLFEAITYLPEYGLTRADERLLASQLDHVIRLALQRAGEPFARSDIVRQIHPRHQHRSVLIRQPIDDIAAAQLYSSSVEIVLGAKQLHFCAVGIDRDQAG